jgi:hypothetical protein
MVAGHNSGPPFGARQVPVMAAAIVGLILAEGMLTTALAQGTPPDSRVAIDVSGGLQATITTVSQAITFEQYSETGSLTSTYSTGRRPVAEGGLTVRLWRAFGVGVSGSYVHDSGSAQVNALVPNPLVAGQPRQVDGPAGVAHSEVAMNFQATYWTTLGERLDLVVSGGPSIFRVDQDFVSDVTYTQTFPYTIATYQGASVLRQRATVGGGNIGGAVGWRVARHFGLEATGRFSRASADFAGTSAQTVVVGGLHFGGGIRVLF